VIGTSGHEKAKIIYRGMARMIADSGRYNSSGLSYMVDTTFVLVRPACYSQQIEPALVEFSRCGDRTAIVSLLHQGKHRLRNVPAEQNPVAYSGSDYDAFQDALNVIEGREFYGPSTNHIPPHKGARTSRKDLKTFIETQVYSLLFWSNCVAYDSGVPAELTLTRGRLLPYLYEHSSDLEMAFTGGLRGTTLALLPTKELLAKDDLARLAKQLDRVPAPDDDAEFKKAQAKWESLRHSGNRVFFSSQYADVFGEPPSVQFNELKQMLNKALSSPYLAIVQDIE